MLEGERGKSEKYKDVRRRKKKDETYKEFSCKEQMFRQMF